MGRTRTIIVVDDDVKKKFKAEVALNNTDMSTVTEALWRQYLIISLNKRKERYEQYSIEKATSMSTQDEL